MMIFFDAAIALTVAFLTLRNSGTTKRHLVALLTTGAVSGIVAFATFEMTNPYAGYADAARYNATMDSLLAWVLGLLAGFVLGAIAAKLFRPKAESKPA